jgi:hypothetical protein
VEFLHSKFTKKSEISLYPTGFKDFGIFAIPVLSGGQKLPENRDLQKINVK